MWSFRSDPMTGRVKRLFIQPMDIVQFLCAAMLAKKSGGPMTLDMPYIELPDDAVVNAIQWDFDRQRFSVIVESKEFPERARNEVIPTMEQPVRGPMTVAVGEARDTLYKEWAKRKRRMEEQAANLLVNVPGQPAQRQTADGRLIFYNLPLPDGAVAFWNDSTCEVSYRDPTTPMPKLVVIKVFPDSFRVVDRREKLNYEKVEGAKLPESVKNVATTNNPAYTQGCFKCVDVDAIRTRIDALKVNNSPIGTVDVTGFAVLEEDGGIVRLSDGIDPGEALVGYGESCRIIQPAEAVPYWEFTTRAGYTGTGAHPKEAEECARAHEKQVLGSANRLNDAIEGKKINIPIASLKAVGKDWDGSVKPVDQLTGLRPMGRLPSDFANGNDLVPDPKVREMMDAITESDDAPHPTPLADLKKFAESVRHMSKPMVCEHAMVVDGVCAKCQKKM